MIGGTLLLAEGSKVGKNSVHSEIKNIHYSILRFLPETKVVANGITNKFVFHENFPI